MGGRERCYLLGWHAHDRGIERLRCRLSGEQGIVWLAGWDAAAKAREEVLRGNDGSRATGAK